MKNYFRFKSVGFTLAEVLITIGIIGIVAAMTIPTIMSNLRAQKLKSQFEKTYADLNIASRAFYADNDMSFTEYQVSKYKGSPYNDESLKYFMSYFKGHQSDSIPKYFDAKRKLQNLNLNGQEISSYPCDESATELDITGRIYSLDDNSGYYPSLSHGPKICVDINGIDKPNKWGVDRFVFVFAQTGSVVPYTGSSWNNMTSQLTDDKVIAKYCSTSIATPAHSCAYFALKNISPTGNGDYWHDFLRGK